MAKGKRKTSRTSRPDVSVCRRSQEQRLLAALRRARKDSTTVTVPRLLQMGLAHFGWRIFTLRCRGFEIRNRMSRRPGGTTISEYELIFDPEKDRR
jgi:Helix-turn-helix domain